jgi:predicted dehydrogenase
VREVRYGMIGGGEGAFIGAAHRTAARLAGNIALVAGALSSEPERARRSGTAIGLPAERTYGSYREMFAGERELPADRRMEFVVIVTPNHVHAPAAIAAMEAGFHVLTDKPLADALESAQQISDVVTRTGRLFGITHTYTGYPMVKQARALVARGALGAVRRVHVSYTQDWLSRAVDTAANKQAQWRTDPVRSGEAGAFGDIGTHAFNLVEYITGDRVTRLCAELRAVVPGRDLDDDGSALFHLSRGGAGMLSASQVCTGDINALTLSIYCDEAGIHWHQEDPSTLQVKHRDKPAEIWTAGANRPYLSPEAVAATRLPAGHPEGYLEAFANIYGAFADDVRRGAASANPGYATIEDGIAAMRFIRAARLSSERGAAWVDLADLKEHIA